MTGSRVILEVLPVSCAEGDIFSRGGRPLEKEQVHAPCHEFSVGCVEFEVLMDQMSRRNCTLESGGNLAEDKHLKVSDIL